MVAGWTKRRIGMGLAGAALMLIASGAALGTCPGDTDNDALVGVGDFLNVLANWGSGPFEPAGADTNGDGVVDVADFLAVIGGWGPCPAEPHLHGYSNSGCLPAQAFEYEPCPDEDAFELTVVGDRLSVSHLNATYNCCPEDIVVELTVGEWLILLTEREILETPCDCMCCYEVSCTVGGLAPGAHTVEYRWFDYETDQEQCYGDVVVVEGDPA